MSYNKSVEEYFFNTPYGGELVGDYPEVIEHQQGQYGVGDVVTLSVALDSAKQQICAVKFKAYGNPYLIAAMAMICQQLDGANIAELAAIDRDEIINTLDVPSTKLHSVLLAEDAYNELTKKVGRAVRDK